MAKIIDFSGLPQNSYVSVAEFAHCRVCGKYQDLRSGACFDCADRVSGKKIEGGHELWETDNPANRWTVIMQ